MKKLKLYDWNGTLVTLDGLRAYFEEHHAQLWHEYKILGDRDPELKKKHLPRMMELVEYATQNDLYPVNVMPRAVERLQADQTEGFRRVVFTSISRELLRKQSRELGIANLVDEVITLEDMKQEFGLEGVTKESPETYQALVQFLQQHNLGICETYTDDGKPRIITAVEVNRIFS